jgi:hypothetical protein
MHMMPLDDSAYVTPPPGLAAAAAKAKALLFQPGGLWGDAASPSPGDAAEPVV